MVAELCSYPFSSYPAFIGQVKTPKWLELNWLLSLFGQSRRSAAKNYRDFVEKVDIASVENPAKGSQEKYGTRCGDLSCQGAERRKRC